MYGQLSKTSLVLAAAIVLVSACFGSSIAQVDSKRVKFADDEKITPRRANGDHIVFLTDYDHVNKNKPEEKHANESLAIPLDLIQRINSIDNFTELQNLLNFEFEIGNRFGSDELDQVDRKGAVMPKPAICKPELVTVPLQNSEDRSILYYPSCTRVERCGGCCSHDLLSCQPTATELINYQVIVTKFEGGTKLTYKGKEIVTVEQHTKCRCDCKVKESDCNSLQEFNKAECRCVCLNVDEEMKCIQENDTKLWDPSECICACRQTKECSTGFYFDHKTCGCTQVPIIRRRAGDSNGEERFRRGENAPQKYRLSSRTVVPLENKE